MDNIDDPVASLYHFFLMGLAWLREENPKVLARRGASVFSCYEHATPVFKSARMLAIGSWNLMERVRDNSHLYEGEKHLGMRELRKLIAESDKHNVVLMVPEADLAPDKLFGPNGYSHAITDAGIEFAMSVAGNYSQIVTIKTFLQGWAKHKDRMSNFQAKQGSSSQAMGGEGVAEGGIGYIPPAPYGEGDFDWND